MKLHILKIKEEYWNEILRGDKSFELRKYDRDYQVGDLIHFVKTDGYEFFGHSKDVFRIIYILKDVSDYGFNKDYCILEFKKLEIR